MNHSQAQLFDARIVRDRAIQAAVDHADKQSPKWSEAALEFVRGYCAIHKLPFVCDELRAWAEQRGLQEPPTRMAWGSVMVQAKKAGYIAKMGFVQGVYPDRKNTHMQTVTQWESAEKAA